MDWISIKNILESSLSPSQLRSKWSKVAHLNLETIFQERQTEVREAQECKVCNSSAPGGDSGCEWCYVKRVCCKANCLGRQHFPRRLRIAEELLQVQSLQQAVRLLHMDFCTGREETKSLLSKLRRYEGKNVICSISISHVPFL